jgi:RNase P subunit RPR2
VEDAHCRICNRPIKEWFLKLTVEDNSGLSETALICANCGVKLRLASEKTRDLQIDPWIHEAVANILRGRNR